MFNVVSIEFHDLPMLWQWFHSCYSLFYARSIDFVVFQVPFPWILVLVGSAAQGCWGAVAVVNPWIPVLVGSAAQGCWGAVALVNPWILVLLGGAAQGCWAAVAVVNPWTLVLLVVGVAPPY